MNTEPEYRGLFAFVSKHYNGDYPLGRSYWVNLVLLAQVLVTVPATVFIAWLGEQDFYPRYLSAAILAVFAFAFVAWVWGIKGTWSSSNKHVARGGKAFWAGAARVMIVLGALGTLGQVGLRLPELEEHLRVALGEQLGPEFTLQIRADGRSILLQGGINDGAAEALAKALDMAPSVTTVVLQSRGGWIREGERLARLIAARGLDTYVEGECTSACTVAFLGGARRAAEPDARIGFHAPRAVGGNDPQNKAAVESEAESIYRRAGISHSFIAKVLKTPHEKAWYPSHAEMIDAGVLTRRSLGGETATIATAKPKREFLDETFSRIPVWAALKERYPATFNTALDEMVKAAEAGESDAEVLASARVKIVALVEQLLPNASDAIVVEYLRLASDQANHLRQRNPEACSEYFFPTGRAMNVVAILSPELQDREQAFTVKLIRDGGGQAPKKPSAAEVERAVNKVVGALTEEQLEFFVLAERRAESSVKACDAIRAYLNVMNGLPEKERARTLRALNAAE